MLAKHWVDEYKGKQRVTGKTYTVPGHWRLGQAPGVKIRRPRNAAFKPRSTAAPGAPNVHASVLRFLDVGFCKREKLVTPNCVAAFARLVRVKSALQTTS